MKALHPHQRSFVFDKSKRKAALCSRRAGKTEGVAAWLLNGAEDAAGQMSLYIATSRNQARLAMWATMEALERRHNLGLRFQEKDNQLWVVTPNKHKIWLAGCKDSAEIDKFRGTKYKNVCIDEAASYGPFIKELIEDVLDPALLDLNGDLALTGTPGVIPTGYFYSVTTGDGTDADGYRIEKWPTHYWTMLDNPYVQTPEEEMVEELERSKRAGYVNQRALYWLQEKMRRSGWDEKHPTYLREYCGQWVRDEGALVFPYDSSRNSFFGLPDEDSSAWTYGLGIDVGYKDDTAFMVGAMRRGHPEVYLVHAEKREGMIPSAVAAHVERLRLQFGIKRIVIDSGGLGKGYQMEMLNRYGIFCEPAKKNNKLAYIHIVRGELRSGNIKIHPRACAPLLDEWARITWNEDKTEPDDRFDDHASDAAIYLVRDMHSYYRPDIERSPLNYEQMLRKQTDEHKARLSRDILKEQRGRRGFSNAMRRIAEGK